MTLDGKALSFTYDHQTGALHAALPAADGKAHRIAVIAGDASGNLARTGLSITPSELSAAFPDTDGHWANAAVSFLKASGVTNGDDLGNFNPDSPITRQEFAVLLCRWLTPAQDTSSVELPFADNGSIADWAKDGVRAHVFPRRNEGQLRRLRPALLPPHRDHQPSGGADDARPSP